MSCFNDSLQSTHLLNFLGQWAVPFAILSSKISKNGLALSSDWQYKPYWIIEAVDGVNSSSKRFCLSRHFEGEAVCLDVLKVSNIAKQG